jgi:hypothetical protein
MRDNQGNRLQNDQLSETCACAGREAVLKRYDGACFSGRSRQLWAQTLSRFVRLIPPASAPAPFASQFFRGSFDAAFAPDSAGASAIADSIFASADLPRVAPAAWTPQAIRANLMAASVALFGLAQRMMDSQPHLCNKFFDAQGRDLALAALAALAKGGRIADFSGPF